MKIDPITSLRPTNRELGEGINQIHDCFEDYKGTTDRAMKTLRDEVKDIKTALGIDGDRRRVSGLSSTRGAFFRTFGATMASMGGVVIVWKILAVAAPSLALLFKTLNDAVLTGKF